MERIHPPRRRRRWVSVARGTLVLAVVSAVTVAACLYMSGVLGAVALGVAR